MKKILSSIVLGTVLFTGAIAQAGVFNAPSIAEAAQKEVSVYVDGKKVNFTDANPYIDGNNRTMLPLRAVSEAFNCKVNWIDPSVEILDGDNKYVFTVDSKNYKVNGKTKVMDTVMVKKNNRTYVPLRFLGELFGEVKWNQAQYRVDINTKEAPVDTSKPQNGALMTFEQKINTFGTNPHPDYMNDMKNRNQITWYDECPYEVYYEMGTYGSENQFTAKFMKFKGLKHHNGFTSSKGEIRMFTGSTNGINAKIAKNIEYFVISDPNEDTIFHYIAFPNPVR